MDNSDLEKARDAADPHRKTLSELIKSTQGVGRLVDSVAKIDTGVTPGLTRHLDTVGKAFAAAKIGPLQSVLDHAVTTDWHKQLRMNSFKATSSPALDRIEALYKRINPEVFTARDLESAPQPPLISSGFVSLHSVMEREAKEKRARDDEQTALLREMVDTAKSTVAAAERNEKIAIRDALDSRKATRHARVVALLGVLVAVLSAWESLQKFFFFLTEKLL